MCRIKLYYMYSYVAEIYVIIYQILCLVPTYQLQKISMHAVYLKFKFSRTIKNLRAQFYTT